MIQDHRVVFSGVFQDCWLLLRLLWYLHRCWNSRFQGNLSLSVALDYNGGRWTNFPATFGLFRRVRVRGVRVRRVGSVGRSLGSMLLGDVDVDQRRGVRIEEAVGTFQDFVVQQGGQDVGHGGAGTRRRQTVGSVDRRQRLEAVAAAELAQQRRRRIGGVGVAHLHRDEVDHLFQRQAAPAGRAHHDDGVLRRPARHLPRVQPA